MQQKPMTISAREAAAAGNPGKPTPAPLDHREGRRLLLRCRYTVFGQESFRDPAGFAVLSPTGKTQDPNKLRAQADELATSNSRRLHLTFTDEKNRAERLVTEFSPWKKTCVSRNTEGVQSYSMELYYDARDAHEIADRLLTYGEGIRITSDSGDVTHHLFCRRKAPDPIT